MTLAAAEAFPLVLSLSCAVTWLQIATLRRSKKGSATLTVVSLPSKPPPTRAKLETDSKAQISREG